MARPGHGTKAGAWDGAARKPRLSSALQDPWRKFLKHIYTGKGVESSRASLLQKSQSPKSPLNTRRRNTRRHARTVHAACHLGRDALVPGIRALQVRRCVPSHRGVRLVPRCVAESRPRPTFPPSEATF